MSNETKAPCHQKPRRACDGNRLCRVCGTCDGVGFLCCAGCQRSNSRVARFTRVELARARMVERGREVLATLHRLLDRVDVR